ncbi:MAG: hypothetical protein Q9167_000111 [Letrouitia subvulpina]
MPEVSIPETCGPALLFPGDRENRKRKSTLGFLPLPKRGCSQQVAPLSLTDSNVQRYPEWSDEVNDFAEEPNSNQSAPDFRGPFVDDDTEEESEPTAHIKENPYPCKGIENVSVCEIISESCSAEVQDSASAGPTCARSMAKSSSGVRFVVEPKIQRPAVSFRGLAALRSSTAPGEATKEIYGVKIHLLLNQTAATPDVIRQPFNNPDIDTRAALPKISEVGKTSKIKNHLLWSEKYRATKFTDLVGDERTHRDALRWIKNWDSIVFPGIKKHKLKATNNGTVTEDRLHRKILLLAGPPGLGKTTLAHVCARQAGYEVVEINASDERSREIVKGRIKDMVGTETVKSIKVKNDGTSARRAGRPVCIVVDEVDGAVAGHGSSGEGSFIKALIDLALLDQSNSRFSQSTSTTKPGGRKGRKDGKFQLLRPLILICNDVYHPSLRLLRQSPAAEVIHVRTPPLDKVVARLKFVFREEGIACDDDGVRKLCESMLGINERQKQNNGTRICSDGDVRGLMVVAEWMARKLKTERTTRLTRKWVDQYFALNPSKADGAQGLLRGGVRGVAERVFLHDGGLNKNTTTLTFDGARSTSDTSSRTSDILRDTAKGSPVERLRELVKTNGECDRIMTECFSAYPSKPFRDDLFLSKPNTAYEWFFFHDAISSKVYSNQEWELSPYLSESALGLHCLFASTTKEGPMTGWLGQEEASDQEPPPFSGPRADYLASESLKQSAAVLQSLQSSLPVNLLRSFRSLDATAIDLSPYLIKILIPDVKPVIVGGTGEQRGVVSIRKESERNMLQRAVSTMKTMGITLEINRGEAGQSNELFNHAYRLEPPLDTLTTFETADLTKPSLARTQLAIYQALVQEHQNLLARKRTDASHGRYNTSDVLNDGTASVAPRIERLAHQMNGMRNKPGLKLQDLFGRARGETSQTVSEDSKAIPPLKGKEQASCREAWVSFHEGWSNAVRKPITLDELMRGFMS